MCLKEKLESIYFAVLWGKKHFWGLRTKKVVYRDKENRLSSAINSVHVFWSRPTYASTQELFSVKWNHYLFFQKGNLRLNGRGCFSFSNIDLFLILSRLPNFFQKSTEQHVEFFESKVIRLGLRNQNNIVHTSLNFFRGYLSRQTNSVKKKTDIE